MFLLKFIAIHALIFVLVLLATFLIGVILAGKDKPEDKDQDNDWSEVG